MTPVPSPANDDDVQDKGESPGSAEKLSEPLNVWIREDWNSSFTPLRSSWWSSMGPMFIAELFVVVPPRKCCLMKSSIIGCP